MDTQTTRLPRARDENMLKGNLPDGLMAYDTSRDTIHSLNRTAALVWQSCDGQTTVEEMITRLRQLDLPASEEVVWLALNRLAKAHLLQDPLTGPAAGISRRAVIRKLGKAASVAALIPVVTSIAAPTRPWQSRSTARMGSPTAPT